MTQVNDLGDVSTSASARPPCALAADATMDRPSPEPGGFPVRPVEAAKRLEQPGYLVRRDAPAVGDGQLGDARVGVGAGEHLAAGHVVPYGVVDEFAGQPFQEVSPATCTSFSGVDPDLPGRGGRADQVAGVFDRGGRHRFRNRTDPGDAV